MSQRSASPQMQDSPLRQPVPPADPAAFGRQAAVAQGDGVAAILRHISALETDPGGAEGHFELGTLLFGARRFEDAVAALEIAARLSPLNPQVRHNLGLALARTGDAIRARAEFAEAVSLAPDETAYIRALALFDLSTGRADAAEAGFRSLVTHDPRDRASHRNLARLARYEPGDPHIAQMENLLDKGDPTPDAGIDLGFALFDALGKAGLPEQAFRRLTEANRLRRGKFPYDAASERLVFEQIERFFREDLFDDVLDSDQPAGPIFIVGMPRAGTTLVEQILSSHPDVAAGGESLAMTELVRRFLIAPHSPGLSLSTSFFSVERRAAMRGFYLSAMRDVAGRAPRFTDKMPLNFHWIGVIAAILPEARFVHCRRDPIETCFSIHSSFFSSGGNRYGHDLRDLADYYRQYRRLMRHWHRVLPGRILDIELADVVADQEGRTRQLLDFLGLGFDPNCLAPHANRSQVATLSSLQVKKPVYGGHSERLEAYLPFLGPLLALRDEV